MKRTYKVIDSAGAMHRVLGDTMVSDGQRVVFWSEDHEVGSFLGAVAAVEELPPVPPADLVNATAEQLTPGEMVSFDPPPSITIGAINITVAAGENAAPPAPADLVGLLDGMRQKLPESARGECLNAVLCFVGELVSNPIIGDAARDIETLRRLGSAVGRMQEAAGQYLRTKDDAAMK